ncbi:UDP-4-amino-4,6-dideoxy-N-acetyl-beta-L-altrosamine N-acetyltransferase [Psychrobacter pulmonis]|uniref:UDP-4-amino-4, 6-dideoxy-N-acetyl-beta-L-altrosamine N-acetyltransferase n=1 Tax=Psychrobacter pulmonis TaxID=228654 RepID=UPI001919DA1C|nr:UDP-4-amino-4,6-dideoxy-N-acetyl-beta-L-altrosamine N-acetyltransferase [Psychrobacter pulmonis]
MIVDTPSFGEVELLTLTSLSYEEKLKVLEMRNHLKVRSQMHGQDIIDEQGHLKFIESLQESAEKQYFMVKHQKSIVGVIYFTDIDHNTQNAVFGVYANLYKKVDRAGSILMESALAFFKKSTKLKTINLEVFESNTIAKNLYIKFGFSLDKSFDKGSEKLITMQLTKDDL